VWRGAFEIGQSLTAAALAWRRHFAHANTVATSARRRFMAK